MFDLILVSLEFPKSLNVQACRRRGDLTELIKILFGNTQKTVSL